MYLTIFVVYGTNSSCCALVVSFSQIHMAVQIGPDLDLLTVHSTLKRNRHVIINRN